MLRFILWHCHLDKSRNGEGSNDPVGHVDCAMDGLDDMCSDTRGAPSQASIDGRKQQAGWPGGVIASVGHAIRVSKRPSKIFVRVFARNPTWFS